MKLCELEGCQQAVIEHEGLHIEIERGVDAVIIRQTVPNPQNKLELWNLGPQNNPDWSQFCGLYHDVVEARYAAGLLQLEVWVATTKTGKMLACSKGATSH